MEKEYLKTLLTDRPIAFHPSLARLLGSVNAALLLQQLIYWSDKGSDPDGWIYKTIEEIQEETTLTRKQQDVAIKKILALKLIEKEVRGTPPKRYFRPIFGAVFNLYKRDKSICTKGANQFVQKGQIIYTENTTESTYITSLKKIKKTKKSLKDIKEEDVEKLAVKLTEKYKQRITTAFVRSKLDDLENYCKRSGRRYKDYMAALENFCKGDIIKGKGVSSVERQRVAVITPDPTWDS